MCFQITLSFNAYSSTTAYNIGSFVTASSVNYESLINGNVGQIPTVLLLAGGLYLIGAFVLPWTALTVPAPPPGRDAVAYFLNDARRGYFDYHATAMAVMLRTLGIPARVASGYKGGEYAETDHSFIVRGAMAHLWVEVLFPVRCYVNRVHFSVSLLK